MFFLHQWRLLAILMLYIWIYSFVFSAHIQFATQRKQQYQDYNDYLDCLIIDRIFQNVRLPSPPPPPLSLSLSLSLSLPNSLRLQKVRCANEFHYR